MAIFYIIKRASGWWHLFNNGSKEVNISDFQAVLDGVNQTFIIQNLNGANTPQIPVSILDIIVIDETDASTEETFANVELLKVRLTALGYTPYLGAGNADAITGLIQEGTNITITGSGTLADPYIINSSGGGATPDLEAVLGVGGRGIKIVDVESAETFNYNFELEDKGKLLYFVNDTELTGATLTVIADLFELGDELQFFINESNTFELITPSSSPFPLLGIQRYSAVKINDGDDFLARFQLYQMPSGVATNLSYTASPTDGKVNSDTGTDATLPLADATNAGLLKPDKYSVLENTSGTNTGDNSANTNSNAYADAKVTNVITNGVTDKAPSEDAVFDALALKADLASPTFTGTPNAPTQSANDNTTKIATTAYADAKVANAITDGVTTIAPSQNAVFDALAKIENFIYSKSGGSYGTHTGNTTETVLLSIDINAGEFVEGDLMSFMATVNKTGTAGTYQIRFRAGTTGTIADALIATGVNSANTDLTASNKRERMQFLSGNILAGIRNVSALTTDVTTASVYTQTSLTYSSAWKFTITGQLGSGADSITLNQYRIGKTKTF